MTNTPIRPTDDAARQMVKDILARSNHAALAVLHPDTGLPYVTRCALGLTKDGQAMSLISDLSLHTKALKNNQNCALLVGDAPPKGDPLAFARLTLNATANFIDHGSPDHDTLRAHYLKTHPKAQLYVDFADFRFVVFHATSAALNAGFGKAYELSADDLI